MAQQNLKTVLTRFCLRAYLRISIFLAFVLGSPFLVIGFLVAWAQSWYLAGGGLYSLVWEWDQKLADKMRAEKEE